MSSEKWTNIRGNPQKCHPETRKEMLGHLWNWTCGIEPPENLQDKEEVSDEDEASEEEEASDKEEGPSDEEEAWPVHSLHGPAGAGKSAIAQSLCEKLEAEGHVVASFFFKRGHESRGNASRLFATIAYQLVVLLSEVNSVISQKRGQRSSSSCQVLFDECEGREVQKEILCSFANSGYESARG
ncbi:hypothetical protein B0H14DRAFT_2571931 [Mycena olivaceomarginata]|nr:hypothetical protein B0H14DRAFT_2571931 [Mycena olivaceomarginata]